MTKKSEQEHLKLFGAEWMTHEVEVTGLVNQPLRLTTDDLRTMELTEVRNIGLTCGSGRQDGVINSYRGVRLTKVLEQASINIRHHGAESSIYIVLTTSDGRRALFSYSELFNTVVGEQAIVVIERDGRALDEKEGEIAFISANDLRTGPRRLRYLSKIDVRETSGGESRE